MANSTVTRAGMKARYFTDKGILIILHMGKPGLSEVQLVSQDHIVRKLESYRPEQNPLYKDARILFTIMVSLETWSKNVYTCAVP